jgi:hypothetical protein
MGFLGPFHTTQTVIHALLQQSGEHDGATQRGCVVHSVWPGVVLWFLIGYERKMLCGYAIAVEVVGR